MNKTNFLGHEIIFGTYFLGQWIERTQSNDVQDALAGFQKNPFKNIPLFISVAIEETANLNGKDFNLSLIEICDLIDQNGGLKGEAVQKLLAFFVETVSVKTNEPQTKSTAPKKK
jgi:hypothetical protein